MTRAEPVLLLVLAGAGLLAGPWLATVTARLAGGRSSVALHAGSAVVAAVLLAGAYWLTGARPATVGYAWLALAGLVLAGTDLRAHRLPDVVTLPAAAVCAAAFLVDAALLDSWPALVRAGCAAAVAFLVAAGARALSPSALGFGDVKLLGLLGLALGWAGWGVLAAGVFVGLLVGALGSLLLLAVHRVSWRTAVPFGPPLLVGVAVALLAAGPLP